MNVLLDQVLQTARQLGASDVHLKAGLPPVFRIKGDLRTLRDTPPLTDEVIGTFAVNLMNEKQRETFEKHHDADLSYGTPDGVRYRVNVFKQRGLTGMVLRIIPPEVPAFERLNLPQVVQKLCEEERGLILVTGTTGSGKSTTLAAMIDYINRDRAAHIVTIEDPIEFLHRDKRSIINQREIGFDTETFASALRAALRQDPDVILVGEMRDNETIETALHAAETGHLVMSTLHTLDAVETINRIIRPVPAAPAAADPHRAGARCSRASSRSAWCRAPTARDGPGGRGPGDHGAHPRAASRTRAHRAKSATPSPAGAIRTA